MINQAEFFLNKEPPKIRPVLKSSYKMGFVEQEINQIRLEGREIVNSYNLVNLSQGTVI